MAYVKFWGVRGSIPTPGPSTLRYGGNTPCLELAYAEDKFFILDAGSGIRAFGQHLLQLKKPVHTHIFISHMHWDHIQGFPFFVPAFIPGNSFVFHAAAEADMKLEKILAEQMNPVNFPVQFNELRSQIEYQELYEGSYEFDGVKVDTIYLNHPGYALGYKFQVRHKSVVYVSDNEPYPFYPASAAASNSPSEVQFIEDGNQRIINFCKQADILIHDAQYTPEEYKSKYQWGHSPYDYTVRIALQAGVRILVLFHHDPMHNDEFIDGLVEAAKKISWQAGSKMKIIGAVEGTSLALD